MCKFFYTVTSKNLLSKVIIVLIYQPQQWRRIII